MEEKIGMKEKEIKELYQNINEGKTDEEYG